MSQLPFIEMIRRDPKYSSQIDESSHSMDNERLYCDTCRKTYVNIGKLRYHKRWECGQIIQCHICSKVVTTLYSLKNHIKIHSGYHPYGKKKKIKFQSQ